MDCKGPNSCQNNLEREEQIRKIHTSWLSNSLQHNGNQDSEVLEQEQTYSLAGVVCEVYLKKDVGVF